MTSSSSACCKISRAPSRPTVSIGSCSPATPASASSSSRRNLSLGATFSMRAYLQRLVLSGQSGGYARLLQIPRTTRRDHVFDGPGYWKGDLTARRIQNAWLVVAGGSGFAQRIEVLRHLHVSIHL